MSRRVDKEEAAHLQYETEHVDPGKSQSVMPYLVILVAVAFLLLLMAYFMQQRANQDAIDSLQSTSSSAVESIQNLIDDNGKLQAQVQELEAQVEELEQQSQDYEALFRATDAEAAQLSQSVEAYRLFFRIDRLYRSKRFQDAAELIAQLEALGQPSSLLSDEALSDEDAEVTPLSRYGQIRKQLQEWDYLK